LEISAALKRNIRVVPVLVDDAEMPTADQLPTELVSLVRRQAHEISNSRWKYDTEQLISTLEKILGVTKPPSFVKPAEVRPAQKSWRSKNFKWVAGIFIFLVVLSTFIPEVDDGSEFVIGPGTEIETEINPDKIKEDLPESTYIKEENVVIPKTTNESPKNQPEAKKTENYKNVNGIWYGMNLEGGTYYFVIEQDNKNLNYIEYDINDQQTGSGTGSISNNDITLIYSSNYGVKANIQLKISADGDQLEGTIIEQSLGLSVPISLSKFEF
jgi:hypothetical protein